MPRPSPLTTRPSPAVSRPSPASGPRACSPRAEGPGDALRWAPGVRHRTLAARALHVGSQSHALIAAAHPEEEHAYDGRHLVLCEPGDVLVARRIDPGWVRYWEPFVGGPIDVVTIADRDPEVPLSTLLLRDARMLDLVRQRASDAVLVVFAPTEQERRLAAALELPLWGTPALAARIGTKSGARELAEVHKLSMPPGTIVADPAGVFAAISAFANAGYDEVIVKCDESIGGRGHLRIQSGDRLAMSLAEAELGTQPGPFVVEAWLAGSTVIGSHLEVLPSGETVAAFAWEQIIDSDGVTYLGAAPLALTEAHRAELHDQLLRVGAGVHAAGGFGSYGPDFLLHEGRIVLMEINGRVPATAFPLAAIRAVRGAIGDDFIASRCFADGAARSVDGCLEALDRAGILISAPDPRARGVVPYNLGLLPWGKVDLVALGADRGDARTLLDEARRALARRRRSAAGSPRSTAE
jgi:glutathione synthase/RimK-type ligase-like ATP-grasp enzyme